jgi:cell division transport system ATP-binding protein
MIRFQNVSKIYYNTRALDNLSFYIEQGKLVLLAGPTGSGKTTIFRLIIRDLEPTQGEIQIGEIDVHKLHKSKIRHLRRKVGVVFQDLKLLFDRTVVENVMLPLELSGISEKEARKRAEEVLDDVGLSEKLELFPLQLSGGEKQRVAIARALVFNPEVILADEPTGNLELKTSMQIFELLERINKKGTTVFMATHNDHIIDKTNYRVLRIEGGVLQSDRKSTNKEPETEKKVENKKTERVEDKKEEGKNKKINLESLKKGKK